MPAPAAASANPTRLRGAPRHPLGGLGRRPDAGARRLLHGALFDRGRAARPRRAHHARRRCSRWRCWLPANGPGARRAFRRSTRCRSPISRRSSPPPAPRWRSRRSTPPMRCTIFWCPPPRSFCSGMVALGTLAAALLHGPALAGLGIAAAFATPVLVSSDKPDFWALYIYLAIVTAAAFGLARIRLWRWLAVTTIVFALLWTFPCLDCGPSMVGPHAFHVMAGFILAALLVVCGFMFGPPAEEGEIEPISSGSLAVYLLGATLIVLSSAHADTAIIVFTLLVAGTLFVAWRAEAAVGAVGAAAALVFVVFAEWAVRGNPDMLVLPGGPLPGIGPAATDSAVTTASRHRGDLRSRIRRRRISGAGPLDQRHHPGGMVGRSRVHAAGAAGRALRPHRASRSLDPVCHSGGAAGGRVRRRNRTPCQARGPAGTAGLDRAVRHRHARRAGAGADLCARKRLAHHRAFADVARHRVDLAAAADSVPALARRHSRRDRGAADRLRAAHRRRYGRHHADLQLAVVGLRHSGAVVLGRQHLPAPPRRRRAAARGGSRRRSCSRCCWCSWKSAMPSTAATSTATPPALPKWRCRCARHWRWRSGWNGCGSAPAASSTTSARSCSRCLPAQPACSA